MTDYVCCFCGTTINPGGRDISYFLLVTRWDRPEAEQENQSLWCHFDCLDQRLDESVPRYLAES